MGLLRSSFERSRSIGAAAALTALVAAGAGGVAGTAASATTATPASAASASAAAAAAPGAPGVVSHFDLARKDCVGTARTRASKVWFTVANGVLSDVYEPTVDTTNVETMQFVVTDGRTFTDLQTRDLTYTVLARTRFSATRGGPAPAGLRLYVRLDPTVGGNGGGGSTNGGSDSAVV